MHPTSLSVSEKVFFGGWL